MDQMEPIDIPDQDNLDVFFSSVEEEESLTSPLTGMTTKIGAELEISKTPPLMFVFIESKGKTRRRSVTGSSSMSSKASTARPGCLPHPQIRPLTARPGQRPPWWVQMTRTAETSGGERKNQNLPPRLQENNGRMKLFEMDTSDRDRDRERDRDRDRDGGDYS